MVERKGIETARQPLIFKAGYLGHCNGTPTGSPCPGVLWIDSDARLKTSVWGTSMIHVLPRPLLSLERWQ